MVTYSMVFFSVLTTDVAVDSTMGVTATLDWLVLLAGGSLVHADDVLASLLDGAALNSLFNSS
jgi:hypothetical protein